MHTPIQVESYTSRMLENTMQYRVYYDPISGRDYVFYAYGTNVAYRHKPHGASSFSDRITGWTPAGQSGYSLVNAFDIYFDGNWLYMVFHTVGTGFKATYFRRGTFNSDGTIAWSAAWKAVSGEYFHYFPTIMHDGNRVYIAFHHYDYEDVPPYQFYIFRSTDGLAGQTWTGPYIITTSGGTGYPAGSNRLLKCDSGIALIFSNGTGTHSIVFSTDQGASWSSPVSFSELVYLGNGRGVAIGDVIHLCYFYRPTSGNYQFRHRSIPFNGGTWNNYTVVKDSGATSGSITITAFKRGTEIHAIYIYTFFSDSYTTDPIWFKNSGYGWDAGTNLNEPQYAQWYPNTDREAYPSAGYDLPIIWARKIYTSPYYVEFLQWTPMGVGSANLSCEFKPLRRRPEDWSRFAQIAFSFWGANSGGNLKFKIWNWDNWREGTIPDTHTSHRTLEINLRDLPGSDAFDWKQITDVDFEYPLIGTFHLDKIELLGCPRLHCSMRTNQDFAELVASAEIRQEASKNLSFSTYVYHLLKDLSASTVLRKADYLNLSMSSLIRNLGSKNLSSNMRVSMGSDSKNLSSEVFIPYRASIDGPIMIAGIRNKASKDLSCSIWVEPYSSWIQGPHLWTVIQNLGMEDQNAQITVQLDGTKNLSCETSIRGAGQPQLPAEVQIRIPDTYVDLEQEPGMKEAEVLD